MTVACHRIQDLSRASAACYAKEELQMAVSLYLDYRDGQISAVEDGDTHMACSIGRSMKALREKFDAKLWAREFMRATGGAA